MKLEDPSSKLVSPNPRNSLKLSFCSSIVNYTSEMLGLSAFLSLALGAQAAFETPVRARTPYLVKETHSVPSKWGQIGRVDPSHMLLLQIGLKQGNFDELERRLFEGTSLYDLARSI
jgi:hypothetical protein